MFPASRCRPRMFQMWWRGWLHSVLPEEIDDFRSATNAARDVGEGWATSQRSGGRRAGGAGGPLYSFPRHRSQLAGVAIAWFARSISARRDPARDLSASIRKSSGWRNRKYSLLGAPHRERE